MTVSDDHIAIQLIALWVFVIMNAAIAHQVKWFIAAGGSAALFHWLVNDSG